MTCPGCYWSNVVHMQSVAEIRKAGKDAFVKAVLEIGAKTQDKPFNTDMSFADQIAGFEKYSTPSTELKLMVEDAKKFR